MDNKIAPSRLISAADDVFREVSRAEGYVVPTDLIGTEDYRGPLWGYSKVEVLEATAFLMRLGFIDLTDGVGVSR